MRTFLLLAVASLSLVSFAQQRQDTFDNTSITVTEIVLSPLPDGGCAGRWCGSVTSDDGGVTHAACTPEPVELRAAANQNRCAALAGAGVNRVARQLRFDVDAGGL